MAQGHAHSHGCRQSHRLTRGSWLDENSSSRVTSSTCWDDYITRSRSWPAGANPDYRIHVINAILFAKKVLHSRGIPVAHAREPVHRYPASITTCTTVRSPRIRFTPRTTTSTSSPCTWMDDRCTPILSNQIAMANSPGATSTCSPR